MQQADAYEQRAQININESWRVLERERDTTESAQVFATLAVAYAMLAVAAAAHHA
jgi:hypothetical protein